MIQNIVVARVRSREARFYAPRFARIDLGHPEPSNLGLAGSRLIDSWEKRISSGTDYIYAANAIPCQVLGYAVLLGKSYDADPLFCVNKLVDDDGQIVLDALINAIESRKNDAAIVQAYMRTSEVSDRQI
ncbi:MAG TPA: hypothetical protein VLF90_02995 [Patescibacteria group bacterium]|nr:hypothetical protein [Patescibacteria group bacterium]